MTTWTMTPIKSGTRLRTDHNTFAKMINVNTGAISSDPATPSFAAGVLLEGDEIWIAPADGTEVWKNDKWLHVTKANDVKVPIPGWTAVVHKGVSICSNFKEVTSTPPPVEPAPNFPESFVLTDPNGFKAEYQFVRVIEG